MIDHKLPYCVYRTTHPSGFYYIGKSQTHKILSGEYIGSGVKLNLTLEKPGFTPDTWTTQLVETFETEEQAYATEAELVTVDTLTDPFCMNMAEGGEGGRSFTALAKSRLVPNNHSVASSPSDIKIGDIVIRVDSQGRYCLNDLHRAAGNHPRHAPSQFLRLDDAKEFIEEIVKNSMQLKHSNSHSLNFNCADMHSLNSNYIKPLDSVAGRNGGSYAVKPVVYKYAMWISPKFALEVINTYDQVVKQKIESLTTIEETKTLTIDDVKTHSMFLRDLGLGVEHAALPYVKYVKTTTGFDLMPGITAYKRSLKKQQQ